MVLELNPVTVLNFLLALVIFIIGVVAYQKTRNKTSLYIGVAFGLFAFSHLVTLLGYAQSLEWLLLVVRVISYCIIIYALLCLGFMICKSTV
jgi:uncharacterized membrane protein YhfC